MLYYTECPKCHSMFETACPINNKLCPECKGTMKGILNTDTTKSSKCPHCKRELES